MRSSWDRLRHAISFELGGLALISPLGAWAFGLPVADVGVVGVACAIIATVWTYIYNLAFDAALQRVTGGTQKSFPLRVFHAVVFELALLALLMPVIAWYLDVGLLHALAMDVALPGPTWSTRSCSTGPTTVSFPCRPGTSRRSQARLLSDLPSCLRWRDRGHAIFASDALSREAAGPGRFLTAVDAAFLRAGHAALELDLLQPREALLHQLPDVFGDVLERGDADRGVEIEVPVIQARSMLALDFLDVVFDVVEVDRPAIDLIDGSAEGQLHDEGMSVQPGIGSHRMRCIERELAIRLHRSCPKDLFSVCRLERTAQPAPASAAYPTKIPIMAGSTKPSKGKVLSHLQTVPSPHTVSRTRCCSSRHPACDERIATVLERLKAASPPPAAALPPPRRAQPQANEPAVPVRAALHAILGVDLTQIDGIGPSLALKLVSECGTDLAAWPSAQHYTSWLGLAPHNKISGGKVLSSRTRRSGSRVAALLRLAAGAVGRTQTALGAFYRRLAARVGKAKAITATARKIAVLVYNTLSHGMAYADPGASYYEERYRQRVLSNLRRRAKSLGYILEKAVPASATVVVS